MPAACLRQVAQLNEQGIWDRLHILPRAVPVHLQAHPAGAGIADVSAAQLCTGCAAKAGCVACQGG